LAAVALQVEVGPKTRALIERLAGKVIVEVELGPKTRRVIEEFLQKHGSEPRAASGPPAR
jgi:hypothetical protein